MADDVIGQANVVIGADLSRFERGLERAEHELTRFDRRAAESLGQFQQHMRHTSKEIENVNNHLNKGTHEVTKWGLVWQATGLVVVTALKELAGHAALHGFAKMFPALAGTSSALAALAPLLTAVAVAYIPVTLAITVATEAWAQSVVEMEKVKKMMEDVSATNLTIEGYQRFTKAAEKVKLSQEDLLKTFKNLEAVSRLELGGATLDKRIRQYEQIQIFANNTAKDELRNATTLEAKIKAFASFYNQALMSGERLQALDVGETFLGRDLIERLRTSRNFMKDLVEAADKIKPAELISEQHLFRVQMINLRIEELEKKWAEFNKPPPAPEPTSWVEFGLRMQEIWIGIKEKIFDATKGVSDFFKMFHQILPAIMQLTAVLGGRAGERAGVVDFGPQRQELEDLRKAQEEYALAAWATAKAEEAVAKARATPGFFNRIIIMREGTQVLQDMGFSLEAALEIMVKAEQRTSDLDNATKKLAVTMRDTNLARKATAKQEEELALAYGDTTKSLQGAYAQAFASQKRSVELSELEASMQDQSTIKRQRARMEMLLWNAAVRDGTKFTPTLKKEIEDLGQRFEDAQRKIQSLQNVIAERGIMGRGATQEMEMAARLAELQLKFRELQEAQFQQGKGDNQRRNIERNQELRDAAIRVATIELEEQRMQRLIAVQGHGITVRQRMAQIDRELQILDIAKAGLTREQIDNIRRNAREIAEGTRTLDERIDSEKLNINLMGLSAGAAAKLKEIQEFLNKALREGREIPTDELERYIKKATELGGAVQKAAEDKIKFDLAFERKLLFLSEEDIAIVQRFRKEMGDNIPDILNSSAAATVRLHNALKNLRDEASGVLAGFLKDLNSGTKASEALRNSAKRIMDTFIDMASKRLVATAFSGLFGGDQTGMVAGATAAQPIVTTMATQLYNAFVGGAQVASGLITGGAQAAQTAMTVGGTTAGTQEAAGGAAGGASMATGGTVAGLAIASAMGPIGLAIAAITALVASFGLFGGGDKQAAQKMIQDIKDAIRRREAYADRSLLAQADTQTFGGALFEFDVRAARERQEEAKKAFSSMVELEAALGAERVALLRRFKKEAFDVLSTADPLTETQERLKEIGEAVLTLNELLKKGGIDGLTAVEIEKKRLAAIAKVRKDFVDDLTRTVNEAQGKGFLNEIADLVKALPTQRQTARTLGVDQKLVTQAFAAQIQAIVNEAELAGPAFNALIKAFPVLKGLVVEFTEAAEAARTPGDLAQQRQSLVDAIFKGAQDPESLAGRLAIFERDALRAREEEIKKGGELLSLLIKKQEQDKLDIIRDFQRQEAELRAQAATERASLVDRMMRTQIDTTTLTGQLMEFDRKALRERQEAAKNGSQNLVLLEKVLAAERLEIIDAFNKAAAEKAKQEAEARIRERSSYVDRIFRAGIGDADTLTEQLALFDREAMRERQEAVRNGSTEIALLEQALAAERLQIIRDFNDQALEDAKRLREEMMGISKDIVDYLNGLMTGGDSPLSPRARLAAATKQFDLTLAAARGGDVDALRRITQDADALREASKAVFASGEGYAQTLDRIKTTLGALATQIDQGSAATLGAAITAAGAAPAGGTAPTAPANAAAAAAAAEAQASRELLVAVKALAGTPATSLKAVQTTLVSINERIEVAVDYLLIIAQGVGPRMRPMIDPDWIKKRRQVEFSEDPGRPRVLETANDNNQRLVLELRALRGEVQGLRRENAHNTMRAAGYVGGRVDRVTAAVRQESEADRTNTRITADLASQRSRRSG